MPNMMSTFEALAPLHQEVARAMANGAREAMREHGFAPLNDDNAARLNEACAVFLKARLDRMPSEASVG